MNLWGRIRGMARKSDSAVNSIDILREMFGARSATGKSVNIKNALEVTAALACARVISEGIAQVPLKLFRESEDGKIRLPAKDHPLYKVLHRRPNPWQTSFEYREMLGLHAVLSKGAFSFINRVRGGVITELIPFDPGSVTVKQGADYSLTYEVTAKNGSRKVFPAEAIWHVRGPSWNGYEGLDVVRLAREAIGLSLATEENHAKMHANGAKVGGLYSVEGTLSEKQYPALREWIEKEYSGSGNAWKTMLLDRSAKFTPYTMTGVDSQHLETRRYQVEEVCRAFRVMPIMVGYSDKAATYASAEQMFLAHVVHTLAPWYERLEQSIDCNLLTEADRDGGLYSKFVIEGLLRGAMKDTAEYLLRLTGGGILTRNEARAKLEQNPLDGLDEPLTPVNLQIGTEPQGAGNGAA